MTKTSIRPISAAAVMFGVCVSVLAGCDFPYDGPFGNGGGSGGHGHPEPAIDPCDNPDAIVLEDRLVFRRRRGAPDWESVPLVVPANGMVCVSVVNGPGHATRSSSASIKLGDRELVEPRDLNPFVESLSRNVTAREGQTSLSVKLGSRIGSALQLKVRFVPDASLERIHFEVDPDLTVTRAPTTDYGALRAYGRYRDFDRPDSGFEFLEGQIIVETASASALASILRRWSGRVIETIEADPTIDEPSVYLIAIDPARVDVSNASAVQARVDPDAMGIAQFSSESALATYVAGLTLYAEGQIVTLNIEDDAHEAVGMPGLNGVDSGDAGESAGTTWPNLWFGSAPYSPNPFHWPEYGETVGPYGVTEAWRLLGQAGRASGTEKVAVFDQGFVETPDLVKMEDHTRGPRYGIGDESLSECSGGSACPWHGTDVATVMAADHGNGWGVAGTGAPAIEEIGAFFIARYRHMETRRALRSARRWGARVVNMSYGGDRGRAGRWTVGMFERTINWHDVLVIASAGNDGDNVDETERRGILRREVETGLTWPCEAQGVFCIGGVGQMLVSPLAKRDSSNWGLDDVNLFAPGCLPSSGPPDDVPAVVADRVSMVCGTSFSAPYVAGVAALMAAANSDLSATRIRDILIETAQSSPDPRVTRVIDPFAAVVASFENVPPTLTILNPTEGASVRLSPDGTVLLRASVTDPDDVADSLPVEWTSSLDGAVGVGLSLHVPLSVGEHVLTATVMDSAGNVDAQRVTFTVTSVGSCMVDADCGASDACFTQSCDVAAGVCVATPVASDIFIAEFKDLAFYGNTVSDTLPATCGTPIELPGLFGTARCETAIDPATGGLRVQASYAFVDPVSGVTSVVSGAWLSDDCSVPFLVSSDGTVHGAGCCPP